LSDAGETKNPQPFPARAYDIGDAVNVHLICPTRQGGRAKQIQSAADIETKLLGRGWRNLRPCRAQGGRQMFFVAAVLAILSGLFYAAGRHEIGSLGVAMCQYGSPFCDNPLLVLVAAGLAACWGAFVSVR
jgi:hypothetical protein